MQYQENLENAKYAISCGRKIGAPVFALPEDIVEVIMIMKIDIMMIMMTTTATTMIKFKMI